VQTIDAKSAQCAMSTWGFIPAPRVEKTTMRVSDAPLSAARIDNQPAASPLHVVALLIVDRDSETFANLKSARGASDIYIRCAALLAKSSHAAGYPVTLFTNEEALIRERFEALGVDGPVRIEQRMFVSRLDRSVQHRSAHHKLDVIRELALGEDDRISMLVDLDAVFMRPLRPSELPNVRQIGCYDISSMMRAESAGRSDDDIRNLTRRFRDSSPRWFGGEAIAGSAAKFRELVGYLDQVEPHYWELRDWLYHTGDEAPVSSALNLYLAKGGAISEMGDRRAIVRWWTASRPFRQPDFAALLDRAILHLPADKEFLASMAGAAFDPGTFVAAYRRHARRKLFSRRMKSFLFDRLLQEQPNFVAKL
jgi:hypothetical protein